MHIVTYPLYQIFADFNINHTAVLKISAILDIITVFTVLNVCYVKKNYNSRFIGSPIRFMPYKNYSFTRCLNMLWRPYFKKDGYYGLYIDTTL